MANFKRHEGRIYVEVNSLMVDVLNIAIDDPSPEVSDAFSKFHKALVDASTNADRELPKEK